MAEVTETLVLRTRPTTVEAKRLTEDNRDQLARWVGGWTFGMTYVRWFSGTDQRVVGAEVGDWIVRSAFGEFVRVSDANLLAQYDRVTPAVSE